MWVKRLNRTEDFFRYEVDKSNRIEMMNEDESVTTAFVLYKYWRNNDGEFEMCKSNYRMIVSLETLMSKFVEIDSEIDKELTELREFKRKVDEERLDACLSPFYVGKTEEINTDESVYVTNLDIKYDKTPIPNGEH